MLQVYVQRASNRLCSMCVPHLQEVLSIDGCHAARPCRHDGLLVAWVLDVASCKHTWCINAWGDISNVCFIRYSPGSTVCKPTTVEQQCFFLPTRHTCAGAAWLCLDETIAVKFQLALQKLSRWDVADGEEQAIHLHNNRHV